MAKAIKKKAYLKPDLTDITLKGEEIFLTNCKMSTGTTASTRTNDTNCNLETRCRATITS